MIMDIYTLFVTVHVIGTVLGAGGATIAEVHINTALRDNQVNADEGALLHGTYKVIRVGMALIILSVLGMVWYQIVNDAPGRLLTDKVWFKEFLFIIIIANAVAISNRWVPLWLGAATSFTGWWMATILGALGYMPYSFLAYTILFVGLVLVMAFILHQIRLYTSRAVAGK